MDIKKELNDYEIFVFSTDTNGQHQNYDGRYAVSRLGAIIGKGEGIMGNSYAIPIFQIKNGFQILFNESEQVKYICNFIDFACSNPKHIFIISNNFGIDKNERTITEIRNIFHKSILKCGFDIDNVPKNIILPKIFI